jgi:hypothetical protein
MKKSGFLAHSFLFGSSREPDEDGADISAPTPIRKQIHSHLEQWQSIKRT